ncbi:MAG: FG-GAP-like repeat-containing protein, partial [Microcoleus sp.]
MSAIEQITNALADQKDIEAVHIVSHGSEGTLNLGTDIFNKELLEKKLEHLQQWGKALTANASIILYGCNVAAGESGSQFLTQLHQLTGANIAANTTTTGNRKLGGNWDIIQLIPPSPQKPKLALTETTLKTYRGVLGLTTKVDFTTGNGPRSVSIGDINGDGKPDLAVASGLSNNASILLNTTAAGATTPTFAAKVDFAAGTKPYSVSIGDINGDGKPDLAVANLDGSSASILLNTTATGATTPTFAAKVDFTTNSFPASVSIGDFNSDGKPDLAVVNRFNNNASILLNTTATGATTPTFATKVDFTTGNDSFSVSIGDFNSDGKPDLAVANQGGGNASILLNTTTTGATTPTFATKVDFTTGAGAISSSIGDFNGDGKSDLAVANYGSGNTSILLNTTATGATTPTFATKVDFTTGTGARSVSIGDFNGDGKPDLAVASQGSNNASILLNTTTTGATTPTFATKVDFTTGAGAISSSIGDFNGDGKSDLAVANESSNTASILLNTTPKVTSVSATTANGSYGVGSTIAISVTFNAAVNVTSTPRLQLETGTTDRFATYTSGSGTTALTFNYVVQAGDSSLDLEYLSTSALTLNGGTIKETAATAWDAILTLPALASANSLGGSKAIVIDTTPPTAATFTPADNATAVAVAADLVVTLSEAVQKGTGNIVIKKVSDNSVVETINVTAANVTVSGSSVTVNPTLDLVNGTDYYVEIAAGAIKDLAGNNYAGTTGATAWNFTTAAAVDTTAPT